MVVEFFKSSLVEVFPSVASCFMLFWVLGAVFASLGRALYGK